MASNTEEPLRKKRVASRQIHKDDDVESEEEDGSGTFRRASDEVLSERRIVKVRRTPAPAISAANPFATIRLVAPATNESGNLTEAKLNGSEGKGLEVDHELVGTPKSSDIKAESENFQNEVNGKTSAGESVCPSGTSSETFQQLSSATNAFAGSFGTGFSTIPFVFSSSSSAGLVSSGTGSNTGLFGLPAQPFSSSLHVGSIEVQSAFGADSAGPIAFPPLSVPVVGASNGSGSVGLFGTLNSSATTPSSAQQISSVVSLPEVHVATGEEKEKSVFTADASLFEFRDAWRERGKGELRVNVPEENGKRARLVMRSKGNYRLLLNANLFPDMKLSKMDNRGISFCCANSAAEGKTGLALYAVKMKDASVAAEFLSVVQAHKAIVNAEPKTPESSPKAS